ncbi:MAG TPA: hypothetical protein VGQ16_10240 [Vicinamibacterales bacterium]|nr:hypothetical protein [Vicinamibacterales bacterium]
MPRLARHLPRVLLIAEIVLGFWIFHDVAYVTTYRLYISHRIDSPSRSAAAQRFDIEGSRVVPQIVMRPVKHYKSDESDSLHLSGNSATSNFFDSVAFESTLGHPSTLYAGLRTAGRARYEIRWRRGDPGSPGNIARILAAGEAANATSVAVPVPAEAGIVELVSDGPLTWVDPRLVRDLRIVPLALALTILLCFSAVLARRRTASAADPMIWFRRIALVCGVVFVAGSLEIGLRALGDRVPRSIATERHDLGEVREDPRWEDTRRYGRRLRVRVDALSEWRHGDIVRMGYIPPDVSDASLHRFRFQTDDEGFRNARTRERIDVAALGDSFTDAMTLDARDSWTSVLERQTGLDVQNYGTAGFGPQQELRVLTDYVVRHGPRFVVLAYFAGNDLFDAEAFDEFVRTGVVQYPVPGWQIKHVVSRADTWFVMSALRAAATWTSRYQNAEARPIDASAPPWPAEAPEARRGPWPAEAPEARRGPSFDRGMFTATINGHTLRWAFMPPYLNTLTLSERDLRARTGWTLTRRAIEEMQRVTRAMGAELVVMFLPFKGQIYLPLVEQSMPAAELSAALHFSLRDNPTPPDVAVMMRNRLAQNVMLRGFCTDSGIRFLDTTDALAARVLAGENVYFPDESHLNEIGHRAVADTLAKFLDR